MVKTVYNEEVSSFYFCLCFTNKKRCVGEAVQVWGETSLAGTGDRRPRAYLLCDLGKCLLTFPSLACLLCKVWVVISPISVFVVQIKIIMHKAFNTVSGLNKKPCPH